MRSSVAKWGNSLALRIPKSYAKQLGLKQGSHVEITARANALIVRKPEYTLEELLAKVTPGNRHAEVGTGRARGREKWWA